MASWIHYQNQIKKLGILKNIGIVFGALAGVLVFVVVFALYIWVNEVPRTEVGFTGFVTIDLSDRRHTTLFIAPDVLIGIDDDYSEVTYYRLESPIYDDSLRVFSKQNALMVDGYIDGLSSTEIEDLSSQLWTDVMSDNVTANITRLKLLMLSNNLQNTSYVETPELKFIEASVVDEELTIMVQNGTSIAGLASEAAIWVKNIGGKVVEIGNAPFKVKTTQVTVLSDLPGSPTVKRLVEIFGLEEAHIEPSADPTRFDVVVTVGEDFYGR